MKRSDLIFSALLVPVDYLMLVLTGLFVYYLRFSALEELRPVIFTIPLIQYLKMILIVALIWLPIFALTGLYSLIKPRFSQEFSKIFLGCSVGTMVIVLFIFFQREFFSSRFIILAGWLGAIVFVSFGRLIVHLIKAKLFIRGKGLEPIIVIGSESSREKFVKLIKENPGFGYKILEGLNSVEELKTKWTEQAREISQIIQIDPLLDRSEILEIVDFCNEHQIIFKYATDLFGAISGNVKTETLAGLPLIEIKRTALDGWGKITKRFVDIIGAILGLILLSPLFLIIAILIKLDSAGPVFVGLERIGERGKTFKLYKFRSMIKGAHLMKKNLLKNNERDGPLFKIKDDPRITNVGRFLRKTSLDELPQLINVLRGEMSLVGPRPHEPEEVAQYQKYHRQLLTIKPGITGMAQISGRSELSFEEEARLDIYYIENWSPGLDLQILLKTIPAVLRGKGVA